MLPRLRSRRRLRRENPALAGIEHGDYLTDGRRLYRCVLNDRRTSLMLEDCESLTLVSCPAHRLERSRMRVVRAGEPAPRPQLTPAAPP